MFTFLLLVEHDCLCKLTQDLDPRLFPVWKSKLSRSLIPTKNQLVEKYVIKSLEEVKAVVIIYDLCMSCKTEENFSLMANYCTGQERKTLTLGLPPPLLLVVFTCLGMLWSWWGFLAWRQRFWGLQVIGVAIFGFVGRHWSQNTLMTLFFFTQSPIRHGVPCTYISRVLQGGSEINQVI